MSPVLATSGNKVVEKKGVEGYWCLSKDSASQLPWPEVCTDAIWPLLKVEFIQRLGHLEGQLKESKQVTCYMGSSTCRLCKCLNGDHEFYTETWRWPSGYMHYIEQHNVAPTFEFWKMVLDSTPTIPRTPYEAAAKKKRDY